MSKIDGLFSAAVLVSAVIASVSFSSVLSAPLFLTSVSFTVFLPVVLFAALAGTASSSGELAVVVAAVFLSSATDS